MRCWLALVPLLPLACAAPEESAAPVEDPAATVRVALFNIRELSTAKLETADDPQLQAAARIVQRVRPDVLVINEIDHDYETPGADLASTAVRFATSYLSAGEEAIDYPHAWAAANNTGFLSGLDLNGDGHVATDADRGERRHGDDCFGWGTYPGQYSMAVLSRYPLAGGSARTFQRFLWKDLPGHHIPPGLYSDEALEVLRLSSKSHWDLPVRVGDASLRLLLSHPTPTVFDGDEDRNGRRNFDEIKLWVEYLNDSPALYDDAGRRGGYGSSDPFVIAGDLNARPDERTSRYDGMVAIEQLLGHPRIQDSGPWLTSAGGVEARAEVVARGAGESDPERHAAERSTAPFRGGMRIDYVLPSVDLTVLDGGVFWPAASEDPEGARLAETASDHRLVWLDVRLPRSGF